MLLATLISACGGSFFIEQPGGSLIEYYDKMVWLFRRVPVSQQQQLDVLGGLFLHVLMAILVTYSSILQLPRSTVSRGGWVTMGVEVPSGTKLSLITGGVKDSTEES